MRAVTYEGPGRVALSTRAAPRPGRHEVAVEVTVTGICGTDRSVVAGHLGALPGVVLGHEAVGTIAEVGAEVVGLRVGQRVVVNPTLWCGTCTCCSRGRAQRCSAGHRDLGIDRDGTFAEVVAVPANCVLAVPDGTDDLRAALTEPLACVLRNARAAALGLGERVTVIGGGPIGLIWALVAQGRGAAVEVVEVNDHRAHLARRHGHVVHRRVADVTGGADLVVDATGSCTAEAIEVVADGGRVVAMGFDPTATVAIEPLALALRGVSIIGAGPYTPTDFADAVELAARLPLEGLVTDVLDLGDVDRALRLLGGTDGTYAAGKVLLRPGARS